MKNFINLMKIGFLVVVMLAVASCGGQMSGDNSSKTSAGGHSVDDVAGEWKFVNFESDGSNEKFTECDARTVWYFTKEKGENLTDGTEVMKMEAVAPEDCKWFGFEANWTMLPDGIFISTVRVGGLGGFSNAGTFSIEQLDDERLVLKIFENVYTLER
ncbi:MAG: hypothetical protein ABR597_13760 [Bacteroidales bacterium]